ncbi:MAG: hydroxymyristoyl-ACP dehydratase [Gammaproteobacteria bacterium]|nr:hydroxymyristoyl-ACP dehydratase [Gammaproteobacteria bacterium]
MRFLFVDRIIELIEGKLIRGIKHVTLDDAFLYCNPPQTPTFPPALIGETLGQLAAWNVMATQDFQSRPVAGIVQEATLLRPVKAGETLLLESFIDNLDASAVTYHSIARVGDEPVFTLDGALGPLLPMEDFIDESLVRLQFDQIYHPLENAHPKEEDCHPRESGDPSIMLHSAVRPMPWLHFDRIVSFEPHKTITAEKRVTFSAPYFPDHFPKKPVLPLTVLLECMLNLATHLVPQKTTAATPVRLRKIKMKTFIQPGDVIRTTLTVRSQTAHELTLQSMTELDGKRICVAELIYPMESLT